MPLPTTNMFTKTYDSYCYNHFYFLDRGRKKRNHQMYDIRSCSNAAFENMVNCVNQRSGFNFNLRCTYKTANRFYVVSCKPNHRFLRIIRYRCSISHYINVQGVCCNAVCWFNRTNLLYSYFRKKLVISRGENAQLDFFSLLTLNYDILSSFRDKKKVPPVY